MGFIERAAATGLALNMLVSPTAAKEADPIHQNPPAEASSSQEADLAKYELPLAILKDLVDVTSPSVAEIHDAISGNPSEYIGIADELGYGENYFSEGFLYVIYPDTADESQTMPWNIEIIVTASGGKIQAATVAMRLNSDLGLFSGGSDSIPEFASISSRDLIEASDRLYNVPLGMTNLPWLEDLEINSLFPNYERQFVSQNGAAYLQIVRPDNLLIFSTSYPFPVEVEAREPVNVNGQKG